jgi:uncharacterized membrane protein YidH (DUF202 family)
MNLKIILKNIWNKLLLYLSFLLFAFYLTIGILFLFTDTWSGFLPKGKEIVGLVLIIFGILRLFVSYRRYINKSKHINIQFSQLKKQLIKKPKNDKIEVNAE